MRRLHPAVYRWEYRRHAAFVRCELCVSAGGRHCRLTIGGEDDGWPSVYQLTELSTAIQRHAAIEKALIESGWSLSDYHRRDATQAGPRRGRRSGGARQLGLPHTSDDSPS